MNKVPIVDIMNHSHLLGTTPPIYTNHLRSSSTTSSFSTVHIVMKDDERVITQGKTTGLMRKKAVPSCKRS